MIKLIIGSFILIYYFSKEFDKGAMTRVSNLAELAEYLDTSIVVTTAIVLVAFGLDELF